MTDKKKHSFEAQEIEKNTIAEEVLKQDNVEGQTKIEETTESKSANDIESEQQNVEHEVEQEISQAQKILELESEISELKEQIKKMEMLAQANIQNLQRRHRIELEDAHKYSFSKFAKEMLPIRDYLEMALLDKSDNVEAIKTGVEMTLKHLNSAFENTSIMEINPLGEAFNPNQHNAIRAEKSEEKPNTVIQVLQKGYELNNRILRPALVVIAKSE